MENKIRFNLDTSIDKIVSLSEGYKIFCLRHTCIANILTHIPRNSAFVQCNCKMITPLGALLFVGVCRIDRQIEKERHVQNLEGPHALRTIF